MKNDTTVMSIVSTEFWQPKLDDCGQTGLYFGDRTTAIFTLNMRETISLKS
ncbi:MAG: hypothetical protein AAGE92_08300 [Cyanobacteria bacterium P01_G01_bin.4]